MEYLLISFLAGILTVLAPCVFILLPIILGETQTSKNWKSTLVIIFSLATSILIFTILLKASTLLINVAPEIWKYISGSILILFGITVLFPNLWGIINEKLKLSQKSDQLLHQGTERNNTWGEILIGISLGPIFSSCSPTYALIIVTILPQTPIIGFFNLLFYVLGLSFILILIALFSQSLARRLKWAVDPNGIFKKVLEFIFIIVGVAIIFGLNKSLETFLLDRGIFDPSDIEYFFLDSLNK